MTTSTVLWALSVPAVLFLVYLASLRVTGQMVRGIERDPETVMRKELSRR